MPGWIRPLMRVGTYVKGGYSTVPIAGPRTLSALEKFLGRRLVL